MTDGHVLAFDASLLSIGAIAVLDGRLADAATFIHDDRRRRGLEKYAAVAALQAADVRAFLDRYNRALPVIVEIGANADGTTWTKKDRRVILTDALASGVVLGVARALGFARVEFVAAGRGGWGGKKNQFLGAALPGVELKTNHERDAAALAVWWLSRNGADMERARRDDRHERP